MTLAQSRNRSTLNTRRRKTQIIVPSPGAGYLQVTLMSIPVGGDIGLEAHPETDQFLRLDAGRGRVQMGAAKDKLTFEKEVSDGWCVLVPAGTWHNLSLIHISEPTRLGMISYAVFCLKKKKKKQKKQHNIQ